MSMGIGSDMPERDYSERYECFGRYCEMKSEWNPDDALYILCSHCTRRFECYKALHNTGDTE